MIRRKTICVLAMTLLVSLVSTAHAAKFGVKVVSEAGEPVPGVAVCIGTHGDYKQFGALFTSRSGDVTLDVPNVPLVVTISKNRFTGVRLAEPARRFNLVKEVKLIEGIPGPRCRAGSSLVDNSPGHELTIQDVLVENGVYNVSLFPEVSGEPSHYRISADQSFANAKWKEYSSSIRLDQGLSQGGSVFLQMRKYTVVKNAWLEARSQVMNVAIPKL